MKKIKVTLIIEVPENFGEMEEKKLDMVFADTLYEEGFHLLDSKEFEEVE